MTGEEPGTADGSSPETVRPTTRRRHHRRVVAPPTNPATDTEADRPDAEPGPPSGAPDPAKGGRQDARDSWIREQRPPHWD